MLPGKIAYMDVVCKYMYELWPSIYDGKHFLVTWYNKSIDDMFHLQRIFILGMVISLSQTDVMCRRKKRNKIQRKATYNAFILEMPYMILPITCYSSVNAHCFDTSTFLLEDVLAIYRTLRKILAAKFHCGKTISPSFEFYLVFHG